MTHLATTLAAWHDMVPITNRKAPLTTVGISLDDPDEQRFEQALAELRVPVLERILSAPTKSIEPRKLKKFKDNHKTLPFDFRVAVDAALVGAANEQDPAARKVLLGGVRQDLAARVDEISEALRQSGWRQIGLGVVRSSCPGGSVGGHRRCC
jgi:hypothetical protein